MPKGSMPGERRGGRQRGTTNRRTILIDRILAVGLDRPTARPRELVAALVEDRALPGDTRRALASKTSLQSGARGRELAALFCIVQDASVSLKVRRQAALAVSKALLPEKPAVTKWRATPDQYGFAINPERANEYFDKYYRLRKLKSSGHFKSPAVVQAMRDLQADLDRILERSPCPCPSKYGRMAISDDLAQLGDLRNKRHAGDPLNDDEKAEEAHRRARVESYFNGPEETARRRRKELQDLSLRLRSQRHEKGTAGLKRNAAATLRMLRWLYPALPPPKYQEGDEDDPRVKDHPFATEHPAADGNFYAIKDYSDHNPPFGFPNSNDPPSSHLPPPQ
jgi:hypothetical protein